MKLLLLAVIAALAVCWEHPADAQDSCEILQTESDKAVKRLDRSVVEFNGCVESNGVELCRDKFREMIEATRDHGRIVSDMTRRRCQSAGESVPT